MTPERKQDPHPAGKSPTSTPPAKEARKPWVKKSPVEVVLEQIAKNP